MTATLETRPEVLACSAKQTKSNYEYRYSRLILTTHLTPTKTSNRDFPCIRRHKQRTHEPNEGFDGRVFKGEGGGA